MSQPNHWVGDSEARDVLAFLNAQFPIGAAGTSFAYAFGGWSNRDALAPGFYRRGLEAQNWPQIYPLGFLPKIETDISDGAATIGVRGRQVRVVLGPVRATSAPTAWTSTSSTP